MKTQSIDTTIEAERVRMALFRAASPSRRFALALSLSRTVISLSRAAIRQAHPDASEEEVGLLFVEYHYGEKLARQVRAYLAGRRP
ncbi:MAG: hypothetical protein ACRDGS_06895 [Chloroflexota bacterium]